MDITPSEHFTPVSLSSIYNCHRDELPDNHPIPEMIIGKSGINEFRGIPFDIGPEDGPNVCLLETETISLDLAGQKASYILFLHAVANETVTALPELPAPAEPGTSFGGLVSDYTIEYEDGESVAHSINRRFAIQQYNNDWGSSAMAAIPACKEGSYRSNSEDSILGTIPKSPGVAECRNVSARDSSNQPRAYIYAMPNPHPDKPLKSLKISPSESSVIYGISLTQLVEHPLRFQQRRKLILTLPEGHEFNAIGELDDIEFDLGNVISARQQLLYKDWTADPVDVQPDRSANTVLIEYATHPAAKLYLKTGDGQKSYDLLNLNEAMLDVSPAHRPVKIRVIDKDSRVAVGVRIHFHGEAGEYLPPKGNHRKVNDNWFMDNYGEFANGANDYAYIHGECILDAPLGTVYVEITRGYEIAPLRESFTVDADTNEICFELERVLDWRNRGWVTADTHVHFLSPATAVLEGEGEDVNVVNILASQWGEMFSNVGDFDGVSNYTNTLEGNNGEFIARVGTENRMQVLGHISLLGYSGEMIHPLCSGGATESALGDAQELSMAQWAQQCIDQNGLVVMPHAPNPQCERAANIIMGLVHAMEMMVFNPHDVTISPYGIADWYRFLNLGYAVPVVGGSDKMAASSLLGGIRTYTQLGELELNYENWMTATKSGNTFVTVGPLVEIDLEGTAPGGRIDINGTATLTLNWKVESVRVPVTQIEIIVGGRGVQSHTPANPLSDSGSVEISITESTWVAVRVRGNYKSDDDIAAHSSAIQVIVDQKAIYNQDDAVSVLKQIEGALAYVDTIAARPDADRYRKMRLTLESAHNTMHQRMHSEGVYHDHTVLHGHEHGHEH